MKSRILTLAAILIIFPTLSVHAQKAPGPGELAEATATGNLSRINSLLHRGANPDQPDITGRTALIYALMSGRHELVIKILDANADPDKPGSNNLTPLMKTILMSREDLLILLLSRGADPNLIMDTPSPDVQPVSALSLALDRGEYDIARILTDEGGNPLLLADPARAAANPLNLPELKIPLDARLWRNTAILDDAANSPDWNAGNDEWILHRAARDNDWRLIRDEADNGRPLDKQDEQGVTALMTAAWHGNETIVSLLLQRGADPLIIDMNGSDLLCYAAAAGRMSVVELVLTAIDMETYNPEKSALYYAVGGRRHVVLDQLLDAGLSSVGTDEEGITLLMIAAWIGDAYAVGKLMPLTDGAVMDKAGRTALEWSAAAFERDRSTGREVNDPDRAARHYPVARLLAGRLRNPLIYSTQPATDIQQAVVDAWSPGLNFDAAGDWRDKRPSPVPAIPGDGDLTLYRIFRDEEPGTPSK